MSDFDQQMKAYAEGLQNARCPYSDAALDRAIRGAVWHTAQDEPSPQPPVRHRVWPAVAAAACLAAVLLPIALHAKPSDGIGTVRVDGERIYFACNSGCSPQGTIETFKTLLR